jgi:hypothetical protein
MQFLLSPTIIMPFREKLNRAKDFVLGRSREKKVLPSTDDQLRTSEDLNLHTDTSARIAPVTPTHTFSIREWKA